jgi:hypothetical protein
LMFIWWVAMVSPPLSFAAFIRRFHLEWFHCAFCLGGASFTFSLCLPLIHLEWLCSYHTRHLSGLFPLRNLHRWILFCFALSTLHFRFLFSLYTAW